MKRSEFQKFLYRFSQNPQPAVIQRHVYLWQSSLNELLGASPKNLYTVLDLHDLCRSIEKTPTSIPAARRLLQDEISAWIDRHYRNRGYQKALAVVGADLLFRYQVPLGIFFQQASDTSLVTFVVPASVTTFKPAKPLPAYISFEPEQLFAYVKSQLSDTAIIGEE